jgi:hypothetical protein
MAHRNMCTSIYHFGVKVADNFSTPRYHCQRRVKSLPCQMLFIYRYLL